MTQAFNLLPAQYVERVAERRRVVLTAGALSALVALLMVSAFAQSRQLDQATRRRDVEQARNSELQARRRQLQPFRHLTDGILGRERLLVTTMHTHVSWATVLASLSRALPPDASLTSFTAKSTLPAFGSVPPARPGDAGSVIGSTTLTGYSVRKFTPGVERVLQLLDSVTGLAEPRLQTGTDEKIGALAVTAFEGSTFVDGEVLSGRYAQGLPPENDVDVPVTARAAAPWATSATVPTPSG
ncbi:MAG: hypothetical protein M3203_10385 [Actinomycetota bacterium]|nr:hypothetical protein [Actinomycetota bacterium]